MIRIPIVIGILFLLQACGDSVNGIEEGFSGKYASVDHELIDRISEQPDSKDVPVIRTRRNCMAVIQWPAGGNRSKHPPAPRLMNL